MPQCPKASRHQHPGGQHHCARQRRAAAARAGQTHHRAVPVGRHRGALQTHLCLLEPHHTVSAAVSEWGRPGEVVLCSRLCLSVRAGRGGWSAKGCEVVFRNSTHISCQCYHMTSFAVLMDISRREASDTHASHMIRIRVAPHCNVAFSHSKRTRTERSCPSKS